MRFLNQVRHVVLGTDKYTRLRYVINKNTTNTNARFKEIEQSIKETQDYMIDIIVEIKCLEAKIAKIAKQKVSTKKKTTKQKRTSNVK